MRYARFQSSTLCIEARQLISFSPLCLRPGAICVPCDCRILLVGVGGRALLLDACRGAPLSSSRADNVAMIRPDSSSSFFRRTAFMLTSLSEVLPRVLISVLINMIFYYSCYAPRKIYFLVCISIYSGTLLTVRRHPILQLIFAE